MRTPGVSIEPLDGKTSTRPGSLGTLRLLVTCTNGHDVPVTLEAASTPPGWDVHVVPDHVALDGSQRQVTATIAYAVPDEARAGMAEIAVEASYPDGHSTVSFPLLVEPVRRWGRMATLAGIAAGVVGAAGASFAWARRMRRK